MEYPLSNNEMKKCMEPLEGAATNHVADRNIGITQVFSCINICRVPRTLFEHEAVRSSAQTSSEGPGKC